MAADIAVAAPRRDARIIGLVGAGHFLSHFYILALPPLFPLLKEEFGVSYAALGFAVTVYNLASGMTQVPVGFLVDRIGASRVLVVGLAIEAAAIILLGFTSSYWALIGLLIVAGFGDSVFHPSDYAILNSSVDRGRLGRAFSLHTFAGYLGFAMAPSVMILLTGLIGWRGGLIAAGVVGFIVVAAMLAGRRSFAEGAAAHGHDSGGAPAPKGGAVRMLMTPSILLLFLFYVATAAGGSGIQTFSVAAVVVLYDAPLATASAALTGFLAAGALGVLAGGYLADRTTRHGLLTVGGFAFAAAALAVVGTASLPLTLLIVCLTLSGLAQGMARPARDMMVRAVTPRGQAGKVYGFVSSGLNVGGAIAPVLFGWIVDQGEPRMVFVLSAVFLLIAAGLAGAARRPAAS